MKRLITLILSLFIIQIALGQNERSKQNNTYIIYTEGRSANFPEEKVLLVSSHIITFNNVKSVYTPSLETLLSLAFVELRDKIQWDEKVPNAADYYSISFDHPKIESCTGHSFHSSDSKYGIKDQDSKVSAMEKKRAGIISKYIEEGYKVYQVDFNPMKYNPMRSANARDEEGAPLDFYPRSKLSELWIEMYVPAVIKKRMTYLKGLEEERKKAPSTTSSAKTSDNCQSPYVIQLAQNLEGKYNSYKDGKLAVGSRDQLIANARQILTLCPYNLIAKNVLDALEREQQIQSQMIGSIIESSTRYEIEISRSIFKAHEDNLEQNSIGQDFSLLAKLFYGIPEIAFVAALGFSQERYPAYTFSYSNPQGLPNEFPKSNTPFDVGSYFSINGAAGIGSVIPILKKPYSTIPKIGLALEGLAFLKYGSFNEMTIESHFPDLKKKFTTALRARSGVVIGLTNDFGISLNFGYEKFFMKEEVEGVVQNLSESDGSTAKVKYNANIVNPKSNAMFFGISLLFGN
ncbi:MAG: hypothetical protein ACI35Z_05250 [Sphingobacterium hotanense]